MHILAGDGEKGSGMRAWNAGFHGFINNRLIPTAGGVAANAGFGSSLRTCGMFQLKKP
jgi:hypothetical protein